MHWAHLKENLVCIMDQGSVLSMFFVETYSDDVLTLAISWARSLGSWYTQVWGFMTIENLKEHDGRYPFYLTLHYMLIWMFQMNEKSMWMNSLQHQMHNVSWYPNYFCTLDHLKASHNIVKIAESSPFWI